MADAQIRAVITAEDKASRVLAGFSSSARKVGKVLSVGLAVAGAAIAAIGVKAVKAFTESQNVIAQTNAVLKSTKGVAGVTATQVSKLASSLQNVTRFSDETIQSGENMLLTFTKIGKDIFPQATETMLDMSQALGQDMKSSAIQLGKALQDPVLGVTALRRVGVNFSEKQRDVIQKLVETGRAAEAQKMILKELKTEFGGSARAAGQTFAGQLDILKNKLDDVLETIGLFIIKGITPLVSKFADFVTKFDWSAAIDKTRLAISNLWQNHLVPFGRAIVDVANKIAAYLSPKLMALWNTISLQLIPALKSLWQGVIAPMIPVIGNALVVALGLAIDALNVLIRVISPLINWLGRNKAAVYGVIVAIGTWYALMKAKAAFNAIYNSLAILKATLFAVQTQVGGVRGSFVSLNKYLSTFAGFGIIAGAAVAAAALIIDAGNKAKAAWDDARTSVEKASSSDDAVITRLKKLMKSGTPAQKKAAKNTLKGLAEGGNFASGTNFAPGGMSLVGERGPELVNLPRGSQVIPNNRIEKTMGSQTINFNVNIGMYAGSEMEKRKVAKALFDAYNELMGANLAGMRT